MVDPKRLEGLLQAVRAATGELRSFAAEGDAAIRDTRGWLAAVKYHFIEAIEGCIDTAMHVCSSDGLGPPRDNADAMRLLAAAGVIDDDLGATMAQVVGFRNILVHRYRVVDDERVIENLARLDDIDAYVAALAVLV